jgi:hypothetical protein
LHIVVMLDCDQSAAFLPPQVDAIQLAPAGRQAPRPLQRLARLRCNAPALGAARLDELFPALVSFGPFKDTLGPGWVRLRVETLPWNQIGGAAPGVAVTGFVVGGKSCSEGASMCTEEVLQRHGAA